MRMGKKIFVRVSYIRRSICMFWHTVQSASFKKFRHLVFDSTKPIDQRSSKMKFIALAVALFCAVAYVTAEVQQEEPLEIYNPVRFRREANPQGSVVITGQKPLSGPDRRPSLDIDYKQRVYDRNGVNANAYGGVNIRPGQPAQPHIGLQAERNFKNGFIGGFGQVQRGPGGRPSPTFGLNGGFRFRRDVDDVIEQGEEQ